MPVPDYDSLKKPIYVVCSGQLNVLSECVAVTHGALKKVRIFLF